MTKVLLIGSNGMAGHVIFQYLSEHRDFCIIDIARGGGIWHKASYEVDVTDFARVKAVIFDEKPDVIINCIGILNRDAEENPDKAILLNSYLPHFLAKQSSCIDAKLIHISTDCVFSGDAGSYTENSIKDGRGFYAQSKALGELTYGNNVTLRTSIIGPELKEDGIGLFHWFMNQSGNIKGYSNAFWTGISTLELAKSIIAVINQNLKGLHHLVNGEKISKFDLLTLFKEVFDRSIRIERFENYKVDKSLIKTDNTFKYSVPNYRIMLDEMKEWIVNHRGQYQHYDF